MSRVDLVRHTHGPALTKKYGTLNLLTSALARLDCVSQPLESGRQLAKHHVAVQTTYRRGVDSLTGSRDDIHKRMYPFWRSTSLWVVDPLRVGGDGFFRGHACEKV
jgi:hypothetical protein